MGDVPRASDALAELAASLRLLRMERRLTYKALERRAGLGHTTVSLTLNARKVPTEDTVVALAKALGADPARLLALRDIAAGETAPTAPRISAEDAAFEERYRGYVVKQHGRLTVVGLDLRGAGAACWPLDTAYLSLELASDRDNSFRDRDASAVVERAELALAEKRRGLIRGLAGSGKTTLLQWLAVTSARQTSSDALPHLRGTIPFLLPLRRLDRGSALPGPAHFLEAAGCLLAPQQPPGWADRVLDSGRGLLLIDGIDEVPAQRRRQTEEWLRALIAAYPHSCFFVTTRPTAVPEGWLGGAGFAQLTVRPMNRKDVHVFATRWHKAAGAGPELEERFKDAVRAQRPLGQLATNPLMCALMCALHRDRRGHLPRSRMELYEAALSMLLFRRDDERGIEAPEGIRLTQHEAVQLLQRLAYWLIRNGQAEMAEKTALAVVEDALPAMPAVAGQGDAARVLAHLVSRSGLLRRPTADTVDFVHRTFQDFLGAKAAVEGQDLGLLVRNAHDDQWEDVVRMAVAHARPDERATLLRRLVAQGDQATGHYKRLLHLLAMACLEQATELDPEIRAAVEKRGAALLPPRTYAEAKALAMVGPVILDLLPGPEGLTKQEAEAVVKTATVVGGDAALALLKRYRASSSRRVCLALSGSWSSFDPEEYAEEVIRHLPAECAIPVRNRAALELLPSLPQKSNLSFVGDFSTADIMAAVDAGQLVRLNLSNNHQVTDVGFLRSLPRLHTLQLSRCSEITDLSPLDGLPLTDLLVWDTRPHDLRRVSELPQLEVLNIDLPVHRSHTSSLPVMPRLRELYVWQRNASRSLTGLDAFSALEFLSLHAPAFPEEEREDLTNLPKLTHLRLVEQDMSRLFKNPRLPQVRTLSLSNPTSPVGLTPVEEVFPNLLSLRIYSTAASPVSVDLTPLAGLGLLDIHVSEAQKVLGLDLFPPGTVTVFPEPRA
ncbi:NACHT domain-containing protein [Streptomyces griseocarneus]|uniref:NACHT domain-containing protein n=1 Tax=Streptomyces griseocarneus TaxID=51201 RepID=UPI00167D36AD|nr:NACHT domain-containing protein [Streptomyces griseocarneus]MBZ6472620.1 NACHT domain-containing protein [Streptomyces griseocarneus]GHG46329.1 ATP-binding protein [Streptomyces griseocarneus]